jgi:hypothetical protein
MKSINNVTKYDSKGIKKDLSGVGSKAPVRESSMFGVVKDARGVWWTTFLGGKLEAQNSKAEALRKARNLSL